MNVNRWALAQAEEPSRHPNPGAGFAWARVPVDRPKGAMDVASSDVKVGDWHPTVVNLAVLILLELVAYAVLRYAFRNALGA